MISWLDREAEQTQAKLLEKRIRLLRQIAEVETKQGRLISLCLSKIFSEEELAAHKKQHEEMDAQLTAALDDIDQQIAQIGAAETDILRLKEFTRAIQEILDIAQWEHKQHILKLLGTEIELMVEDGERVIYVTNRLSPEKSRLELLQGKQTGSRGHPENDLSANSISSR